MNGYGSLWLLDFRVYSKLTLAEEEREQIDKRIFRQVLTDDPEEVEKELNEVEKLYQLAYSLRNHKEAKFTQLLEVLDTSDVIRESDEKLLIFTENLNERHTNKL